MVDRHWQVHARALANTLTATGALRHPAWHRAVSQVPRHRLVPRYLEQQPDGALVAHNSGTAEELSTVYSDRTLVTEYLGWQPLSSSTEPGLMIRMLESLDIHDEHRVMEIGTGTGYNAALLSERLGSPNVVSIDVESDLVEQARERLHALGYTPTVLAGDGALGAPEHAPFDRVIATCAVSGIPWPWIEQCAVGGVILTDLKISRSAGSLVRLIKLGDDRAEGQFEPQFASFTNWRPSPHYPDPTFSVDRTVSDSDDTRTALSATPWAAKISWFLAAVDLGNDLRYGYTAPSEPGKQPTSTWIASPDGSWAEVALGHDDAGTRAVRQGGPRRLWDLVEDANALWHDLGNPEWSRFGLTVTADRHTLWLDHPGAEKHWNIATQPKGPTMP
jgi:methyltransferase of ATP-grasp peptide maturase system